MIPIEIASYKSGEIIGRQAFNDILTPQERINRLMLQAFYLAQTTFTQEYYDSLQTIGQNQYTTEQLNNMEKAAFNLVSAITAANEAFEKGLEGKFPETDDNTSGSESEPSEDDVQEVK